jgi:predicted ATPase
MITAFELRNFKCFSQLRLSLKNLTLLTGFNAGGKSSAIQPLLLLTQGLRSAASPKTFALNGSLVRLGTVGDVLPSDSAESIIAFKVSRPTEESSWVFTTRAGDRFLRLIDQATPVAEAATDPDRNLERLSELSRSLAKLTYISAVREGASEAFPIPDGNGHEVGDVGTDGRFAPYWYGQLVDNEVPERRRHPEEPATSLRKQLDAWLAALFPGAQANAQMVSQVSMLSLQFRLSEIGVWHRPANVGYGLTYAFPIIVAMLAAEDDQIVVIDSPEAHLHPSAQSQMGQLLARFAAAGVQILVETHSDHLLNGARLAVKGGVLPHSEMQIHFFTGATKEGHGVISPTLDSNGRIDEWPDGFFDQSEKDLSRLAGWE